MRTCSGLAIVFVFASLLPVSPASAGVALQSFDVISPGPGLANGLFATIGAPAPPQAGMTAWPVTIDMQALGALPQSLLVNFPDRAAVTLTRGRHENRGNGAFFWTGHGGGCSAELDAAPGAQGGVISCPNANYGIGQSPGALTLKRYVDDPAAPPANPLDAPFVAAPTIPNQVPAIPNIPPDTAVDILVLYNAAVRQALDPAGGRTQTLALAKRCVTTLQQALDNSTSPGHPPIMEVNFVAAKEVPGMPAGASIFQNQTYIENDSMPKGLRNFWAADVVVYLIPDGYGRYGTSSIPGSPTFPPPGLAYAPFAVAVVQFNTAIEDDTGANPQEPFVFLHEFAHVIGANHNVEDAANNPTPLEPWAYGYWLPNANKGGMRTILSDKTPQCNGACVRIMNYSNPDITVDWFRTGSASANNALTIHDFAAPPAQYRASLGRIFYDGFDD